MQFGANRDRNHFKRYRQCGLKAFGHVAFRGNSCALDDEQLAVLDVHSQEHLYLTAKALAYWLEHLEPAVRLDETINTDTTIAMFAQLEGFSLAATWIDVTCENALCYRTKSVKEYLKKSRIMLVSFPPYAPNLNLIERLWKFFTNKVLHNRYYGLFDEFRAACETSSATQANNTEKSVHC